MNAPEPQLARQAALLLHTLHANDRTKVLQRLSVSHQEQLGPLLTELDALGIPRDASLLKHVLPQAPQAFLTEADTSTLLDVLREQRLETVACLLSANANSAWQQRVVQHWPAAERAQLKQLVSQAALAPAALINTLQTAFEQAVQQRLDTPSLPPTQ